MAWLRCDIGSIFNQFMDSAIIWPTEDNTIYHIVVMVLTCPSQSNSCTKDDSCHYTLEVELGEKWKKFTPSFGNVPTLWKEINILC